MASSTDVLAERVRTSRQAVDADLEQLRLKTQTLEPGRVAARWSRTVLPVIAGACAVWYWQRRRRSVSSLQQLLVRTLRELHRAEMQMVPALRRLRDAATNPDLGRLFDRHAEESEGHVERLERVFRSVGATPAAGSSAAMAAIDDDARRLLKRKAATDVRDAWLVAVAQRAEHLEIANYGTARTFAATLGHTYAAQLLQQTLDEERAMDEHLSRLAERFLNPQTIQ